MYQEFALIYDSLMGESFYTDYRKNLLAMIKPSGKVLDIGCGTGNLTELFFESGSEVTGLDESEAMLSIASRKLPRVNFLLGKIEDLKLSSFDQIYACVDVLNYYLTKEELVVFLSGVKKHLGGQFFFDLRNPNSMRRDLADRVIYYEDKLGDLVWINELEDSLLYQELVIYWKESKLYKKSQEFHTQRIWEAEEIEQLIEEIGFNLMEKRVTEDRIFYLVE